jgi:hypothetical protein
LSEAKVSLVTAPLRAEIERSKKAILFVAFTDDSNSQWLTLAVLAFIYGSAVMAIVIVTLMKSARKRRTEAQNRA